MNTYPELKTKARMPYLDNVRSMVIILVIVMHSAVTYSGIGDWYYKEGSFDELPLIEKIFFGYLQMFLQSWFMGILFFISAFFAAKALAKRGTLQFIKERLFRLGLPLLIYMFVISPLIGLVLLKFYPEISLLENYCWYITSFEWTGSTGPLWFVEALLIFCIVYAIVKKCFKTTLKIQTIKTKNIIFVIIATGVIAFCVRLIFPIGTSYYNLQFCYFTSYIVLFILGIIAGENDLLDNLVKDSNTKWIQWTLIIGMPLWVCIIIFSGAIDGNTPFEGGLNWPSFAYALWESLTAIGFSIGILSFFKKRINFENNYTKIISDNSFGIYFLHAPLLISVSLILKYLIIDPILKFLLVVIITFFVCLIVSFLLKKIKPVGVLLK